MSHIQFSSSTVVEEIRAIAAANCTHTGKHTNTHSKSCTRTWEISGSECEPQLNRPHSYITLAISVTKHSADIHQRSAPQCHSNLDLIVKKETVPSMMS